MGWMASVLISEGGINPGKEGCMFVVYVEEESERPVCRTLTSSEEDTKRSEFGTPLLTMVGVSFDGFSDKVCEFATLIPLRSTPLGPWINEPPFKKTDEGLEDSKFPFNSTPGEPSEILLPICCMYSVSA